MVEIESRGDAPLGASRSPPHSPRTMTDHTSAPAASTATPELGLTMTRVLRNPLAALRAQIESLAGEFRADDPRQTGLRSALELVLKLSRDVDSLSQFATPRPLAPIECTLEEILQAATRGLPFAQRARVQLALDLSPATVVIDGPALAGALGHLLENALAHSEGEVLLSAREENGTTCFVIVEHGLGGEPASALPEHRSTVLQLGLALARREIERMGGSIRVTTTPLGHTCAQVSIHKSAARRG